MFVSNSTWSPNAATFANSFTIGTDTLGLYIDTNNSIYTINRDNGQILIWMNNSNDTNIILYTQLSDSRSIFVTANREIYVGDYLTIKQIIKSNSNSYSNQTISIANVSFLSIYGLFVDLNNLYYNVQCVSVCLSTLFHEIKDNKRSERSEDRVF